MSIMDWLALFLFFPTIVLLGLIQTYRAWFKDADIAIGVTPYTGDGPAVGLHAFILPTMIGITFLWAATIIAAVDRHNLSSAPTISLWLLSAGFLLLMIGFWMAAFAWPRLHRDEQVGAWSAPAIGTVSALAGHKKDGDTTTEAVLKTAIEGSLTAGFAVGFGALGGACGPAAPMCSAGFGAGGAFVGHELGTFATHYLDDQIGWTAGKIDDFGSSISNVDWTPW